MRARSLIGVTVLVATAGCSAIQKVDVVARDVPYRCDNGQPLLAKFMPDAGEVILTLNDEQEWLYQDASADGARYTGFGGWEFWDKGAEALFTAPGQERTTCRRS